MSRQWKRRSSSIVDMALVNAGIERNSPKCRRRLSYELNTSAACSTNSNMKQFNKTLEPAPISNDTLEDLILADSLRTTTDIETTASITAASILVNHEFNIALTVEPDIDEPTLNDHQVVDNIQYTSLTFDHDVPSTSAGPHKDNNATNSIKSKVGKRKHRNDVKYIDYISDQEDFSTFYGNIDDSDNWSEGQEGITSEDDVLSAKQKVKLNETNTKKRSKALAFDLFLDNDVNTEDNVVGESAMRIKKTNSRKAQSKNKQSGKSYITNKGVAVPSKTVLANPCFGKKCGNDCGSLSEERRESLFNFFWNLDLIRRRDWLVSLSQKENIKRKRTNSNIRNYSIKYFINDGEGRRFVCQQFLAATLNISEKTIYNIVKNASWGCAREDMRGKCEPSNKTKESTIDAVNRFIKNLPAVPSHYCRQDSSKVYLPQEYKNITNLYKLYKQHYVNQGVDVVSDRIFRKIFKDNFNIGFHIPKKDKCLKCLQYENDNNNPEKQREREEHEIEKEESYARFKVHKNNVVFYLREYYTLKIKLVGIVKSINKPR